jgi:hypothetical protein
MTISIQNIINGTLAIAVTLLIYQNSQLQDNIETLEGNARLDTDKTWDRMDKIDEDNKSTDEAIQALKDRIISNMTRINKLEAINQEQNAQLDNIEANIKIVFGNFDKSYKQNEKMSEWSDMSAEKFSALNSNVKINGKRIDKIVEYINSILKELE